MGFVSAADMAQAWADGRVWQQSLHKTATPILTAVGNWGDLAMAAGTPKYNAYVGDQLTYTPLVGAGNAGIYTGAPTETTYLSRMMLGGSGVANTAFPANVMLLDYVGFYPLVDLDSTETQAFSNGSLPARHLGELQLMIVCTTPQTTATPILCQISYENQSGAECLAACYVQAANTGQINCAGANLAGVAANTPFVPLGNVTSRGIRRLLSVTLANSAGGFAAFVLVKPKLTLHIPEAVTPVEIDLLIHRQPLPEFLPGAYLNLIYAPVTAGTVSGIVRGQFDFVRSA